MFPCIIFAFNATKISYLRKKHAINNMFPYGNIGKKRVNPIRPKRGTNCPSTFLLSTALSTIALQYQDLMTFPKNSSIYI